MGKQTKNYRQSPKSFSGSRGASNFGQQNRGAWHQRVINYFRKGANEGNRD